ncbi:MAG: CCA tRNA nucleotidyltransferase [Candidatus Omnitrophica bacterium]|nr:CCA tRNA nucleotidyltransferase [Candidatus Omnitrophota bacterium]
MKDLKDKTIRVLHDKSFIDDPTRIFRAVRFEQRFGFSIEKHTEYLIKHAIKQEMFHRTENQRIRDELVLILKERDPENAVFRMKQLHELRFIHPDLVLKRAISETFNEIKKCVKWYERTAAGKRHLDIWLIHLMAVLEKLKLEQVEEVIGKFVLTRSASVRLVSYKAKAGRAIRKLSSPEKMLPSEVYDLLEPLSHEVALYVMARTRSKTARTRIKKFFTEYNGVKLRIKGHDLIAEGAEPGPGYTRILRQVLCEKLDGKLHAKKDELEYMRKLLNKGKRGKV